MNGGHPTLEDEILRLQMILRDIRLSYFRGKPVRYRWYKALRAAVFGGRPWIDRWRREPFKRPRG
jgi:hypothetical protein